MSLPAILVTGSSGFLGRHLLDALKDQYRIYGLARRSQARSGAPVHRNIRWFQVDIGDREALESVFREVHQGGGVDTVVHLAAHYDFTGEKHPEYERTNVYGLRNVLDLSRDMGIRRFLFSSSVAACAFPRPGGALNEESPPDGDHIYARTKAIGEQMLDLYRGFFPSTIVRFAALFSDWCEYPPLFMFLQTWLSRAWNRRILGGRGRSAIPYLHVRDAVRFVQMTLEQADDLEHHDILIASPDGAVSHEELFLGATHYYFGDMQQPVHMPRPLVLPGIRARCLLGRLSGEMPFERPWMASYVDQIMAIDASRSRQRLSWEPRPRLLILRRLPFLLENLKADPAEWNRRNRAAMKEVQVRPNLRIHHLLSRHAEHISLAFTGMLRARAEAGQLPSYLDVSAAEHSWHHRLILRQLMNAIRTRERSVLLSYCQDLAERRFQQGFAVEELCGALEELNRICMETLVEDPEAEDVLAYLHDHITVNLRFGCDQIQETYERLEASRASVARPGSR